MQSMNCYCSICGVMGQIKGFPSYFAECVDKAACRDRVIYNRDRELAKVNQRIKELETINKDADKEAYSCSFL
jgi:hypothetical protein